MKQLPVPQIYWAVHSLTEKGRTCPHFCCLVLLSMRIECILFIFFRGKEGPMSAETLLKLHVCSVLSKLKY